ncbi:MAG: AMP-binding protein [Clostridia bacterium]|nr:AMP-binding protein [Clostridia bacterium]
MDKKDRKLLDELRHTVHMTGELLTLKMLIERMEIYGERTCMVEKKKDVVTEYSVKRFREDVFALGTALKDMGLMGKHLGILSENSYRWVVAFFAVACGGGVAVPVDKELSDADISALFTKADVEGIFFSRAYKEIAKYHLEHDERCKAAICTNKKLDDDFLFFDELIEKGKELIKAGDTSYIDTEIKKDDLAAIVFTSGTTGANKGVMLSHGNFAQNADGVLETIETQYSSISLLPMNHVYELSCNILTALYMNCPVFINDSLKNFMNNVQFYKPDAMAIVPLVIDTIYNTIWRTAEQTGRAEILKKLLKVSNALRKIGIDLRPVLFKTIAEKFGGKFPTMSCGGAPTRVEYITCLCDFGFTIYNGYGLTESSPTVTLNLDAGTRPDCAGFAFPKAQFKIHEPDDKGVGEIWIRGENVTRGYYKDEEATKASFEDGWFKTGDYGRTDEEGRLYVVGRKKNLIILDNGKNVFPEEVESYYMEAVSYLHDVVVFEAEKEVGGRKQKIIAGAFYVSPEDVDNKSEEEIKAMVEKDILNANKDLTVYKRVQDTYITTKEFEINSTRKVIRSKVIERYYAEINK